MRLSNWLSNKDIQKLYEEKQKHRVVCKCGHTNIILNKSNMCICSHCRQMVFKDKKTEFEYRMKENLIKEKRRKNERRKER